MRLRNLFSLRFFSTLLLPLTAAICLGTACNSSKDPGAGDKATVKADSDEETTDAEKTPAERVLDRLIKNYREAKSYSDKGKIVVRTVGQEEVTEELDNHVEFQRPNLLRLEFQYTLPKALFGSEPAPVLVVANGKQVFARPQGYDGQVVVADDPAKIVVPQFYTLRGFGASVAEQKDHPMKELTSVFRVGVTDRNVVLDLLAAEKPLQGLDRKTAKLLKPQKIGDRACDRVQFNTDGGPLTLWVDHESSVVRRVEYPSNTALLKLIKEKTGVTEIEVTGEMEKAALDPKLDKERFAWEMKDSQLYVKELIVPPDPESLGKPLPTIPMVNSNGEKVNEKSFSGKITVIDLWATWCPYCLQGMPGVEEVRKKYAGNDKVRFLALSIDEQETSDEKIGAALHNIKVNLPWSRVALEQPRQILPQLQLPAIPAMLILSSDGRLQFRHIGMDPDIGKNLPPVIDALLEGDDPGKKANDEWETKQKEFRRKLMEASIDSRTTEIKIPRAVVAAGSEPKTLKLRPLWTAADVKAPGNLLVLEEAKGSPRIFVIDQGQEVVELDAAGKLIVRHADLIPGKPPLTFLRTLTTKDGKRLFIAGKTGGTQFHIFDDQWKLLKTYPEQGTTSIFDVQPADLQGKGENELCVGYFGPAGVHGVGLDGKRLWRNRTIENVAGMAVTGPDAAGARRLLCVDNGLRLVPIRSDGKADPPINYLNHAITHIASADLNGDGQQQYCGIASDSNGEKSAVGFQIDEKGGEVNWQHPLPTGEHERPIEVISKAHLLPDKAGQWLIAAADGSVHILSSDGTQQDQFNSGGTLAGLAAAIADGKPLLLVAHGDKLAAFSVEKR